ncbi:ABC transporter substrate-binding protein [Natronobiforma cellulositropha]|uniref:ABC transporter substrate-binding protein n=1 Tax=Natronobiforma cellulositropha TaxID=1679076 RepID=UPI0021D590A9|nr:ABC transporter substrate-binding protein [Natronobiforma cellulositropha]
MEERSQLSVSGLSARPLESDETGPDARIQALTLADDGADGSFVTAGWQGIETIQYNPHDPVAFAGNHETLLYEPFASYDVDAREWIPHGLESWEFDDDEVLLQLRDDLTWSDGTAVTADDLLTQFVLAFVADDDVWEHLAGVTAVDETTFTLSLAEPVNESSFEFLLLDRTINTPAHVFAEFFDRLNDGEEVDAVGNDLRSFELEEPVASGPFELEERTAEYVRYATRETHPRASAIGVDGFTVEQRSSVAGHVDDLLEGTLDGLDHLLVSTHELESIPDTVTELHHPGTFGYGLAFNHADDHVGRREVRQAIALAIHTDFVADRADPRLTAVPSVPAGLASSITDAVLGEDLEQFDPYDHDCPRATSLLESAGYERTADGSWVDSTGAPLSLTIQYTSGWAEWQVATDTIASQLRDFGMDVTLAPAERGLLESTLSDGDFQVTALEWNTAGVAGFNPAASLAFQLRNRHFDSSTSFLNYPDTVEVPAMDGSDTMEVDLDAAFDLLETAPESQADAIVRDLAWVVNQDLPMLPIYDDVRQVLVRSDRWTVPDEVHSITDQRQLLSWLANRGTLEPAAE